MNTTSHDKVQIGGSRTGIIVAARLSGKNPGFGKVVMTGFDYALKPQETFPFTRAGNATACILKK
jgi:hypothetical protein